MLNCSGRTQLVFCLIIVCTTILASVYYFRESNRKTVFRIINPMVFGQVKTAFNKKDPETSIAVIQDSKETYDLIQASKTSASAQTPIEKRCPMYSEFRGLNFLHPVLRNRLCRNAEAYKQYPDGYPMCLLQHPFDRNLLDIVRQGSEIVSLSDVQNIHIQMFVYKGNDLISNSIRGSRSWEPAMVHWTLRFALKLPDVTFIDAGSNLGVYSLQAAKLGLPVIALDANIRNLLRLRLSLNAASLDAVLVWNFIAQDQNLKYLSFYGDCNVGGAGRLKADLPDTVPVMPLKSERLSDLIKTRNIVMKMDIQGGEADFLLMSGRLFKDFNVAAVQSEWSPTGLRGDESSKIIDFFTEKGYRVWRYPSFQRLDLRKYNTQDEIDVMWIREDFVHMM